MRPAPHPLALVPALALAALRLCVSPASAAIVGGSEDPEHSEVAALLWEGERLCSATLIGPRVLITAAHCLDGFDAVATEIEAVFAADPAAAPAQARVSLQGIERFEPGASDFPSDLARLTLVAVAPGVPGPWNVEPLLDEHIGLPLTVVGFGRTANDDDAPPVRRAAEVGLDDWNEALLFWAGDGAGACHGDSGGAVFGDLGQGPILLGIVEGGDPDCNGDGQATRTDTHDAFFAGLSLGDDDDDDTVFDGDDDDATAPDESGCAVGSAALVFLLLPLKGRRARPGVARGLRASV